MKGKKDRLRAKHKYKKLLIFIAVPVVIIGTAILLFQLYFYGFATNYVEELLEEKIGSYLTLDPALGDSLSVNVQELQFNAFPINVLAPDISIHAASNVYNEDSSAVLYTGVHEAGVINLEISLKPLILIVLGRKKINLKRFQADSVYFSTKSLSKDSGFVSDFRQKFRSGSIRFKGEIELPDNDTTGIEKLKLERHLFQAANLFVYLPEKMYSFHIDSISFDGSLKTIDIEKIKILPTHPKEEFYRHVEFETNRMEIYLDSIEIKGFQTHKKQGRRAIIASQVNIGHGLMDIFRDRRPPFDENIRPVMPTSLIMNAPFDLYVSEINISESDILYSDFPEFGSASRFSEALGIVPLYRLKATVRNITNIADSLQTDSIMRISAETHFFEDAFLQADFIYNLNDSNGSYSAKVNISEFRFGIVNPAVYPLLGIVVEDGIHRSSVFSFSGNDFESIGALYMEWDGLVLNFTPHAGNMKTGIARLLGRLAYRQSSPDNADKLPNAQIYYQRDVTRFVFHYWWQCYLSGVKACVLRDIVSL